MLFDDPIRSDEQACRNFKPKLLRGLKVDDQIPMIDLNERHLCWVAAIENFYDLRSDVRSHQLIVEGIAHQRAGLGHALPWTNCRELIFLHQSTQQSPFDSVFNFG